MPISGKTRDHQISILSTQISAMPKEAIDEIWFRAGVIYKKAGDNNALPDKVILQIKGSENTAYELVEKLCSEKGIDAVVKITNQVGKLNYLGNSGINRKILDSKSFTNLSGETITKKELTDIAKRIRSLPEERIDELWANIGFIYTKKGNNRAMPDSTIKLIKKSKENAEYETMILFDEANIKDITSELQRIQKSIKKNSQKKY